MISARAEAAGAVGVGERDAGTSAAVGIATTSEAAGVSVLPIALCLCTATRTGQDGPGCVGAALVEGLKRPGLACKQHLCQAGQRLVARLQPDTCFTPAPPLLLWSPILVPDHSSGGQAIICSMQAVLPGHALKAPGPHAWHTLAVKPTCFACTPGQLSARQGPPVGLVLTMCMPDSPPAVQTRTARMSVLVEVAAEAEGAVAGAGALTVLPLRSTTRLPSPAWLEPESSRSQIPALAAACAALLAAACLARRQEHTWGCLQQGSACRTLECAALVRIGKLLSHSAGSAAVRVLAAGADDDVDMLSLGPQQCWPAAQQPGASFGIERACRLRLLSTSPLFSFALKKQDSGGGRSGSGGRLLAAHWLSACAQQH